MLKAVVPPLVRVAIMAALVLPTATLPKFKVVGASFTNVPVPVSETVCGLPAALSATDTLAVRVPELAGLKVTLMVQLAPAATEVPQVLVSEKSELLVPVMLIDVMLTALFPSLVRVTL